MRPISILILALAVVAALIFGFVTVSGGRSGRGEAGPRGPADRPETAVQAAELETAGAVAAVPERVAAETERAAVETAPADRTKAMGRIFGVVVNPDDEPIEKARILLLDVKSSLISEALNLVNDQDLPEAVGEVVTDEAGRFELPAVQPGSWTLVVSHDVYNRYEANGIVVGAGAQVEERIVLEYGLSVTGYVHDALSGAPIEGAELVLDSPLAALVPAARRKRAAANQTTTDAFGFFGFRNAGRGQKTLIISARGYATQVHTNFGLAWGHEEHDPQDGPQIFRRNMAKKRRQESKKPVEKRYELQPGRTIAGRVINASSVGLSGIEVTAVDQSGSVGSRGTAVSAADGEFLIEDLAAGAYTVHATAKGFSSQPQHAVETGRTDIEIVLAEHGSVSGRVIVAATGKPVRNFLLKVRALHPDNPSWGNVVARGDFRDRAGGKFSISGVPAGEYAIEGLARGFASSFSTSFFVVDGQVTPEIVVPLTQGGTVRGLVVDGNGDPLSGVEVKTRDNNHVDDEFFELITNLNPTAATKASVRTDEQGEFELELMTPDTYQIVISKRGYSKATLNDVIIDDGVVLDAGVLQLLQGAVVKGTVFGPDNTPAAGASVYLVPADNNSWGGREARTDANGKFVLENAKEGTYKLNATRSESERGNPFTAIVDMRNSEIEISLVDGQVYEQDIHMASVRRAQ